jgi:hypothetical protein
MLSLPCVVRIYLHVEPVNLHLGFDRLANLVREDMGQDPLGGHLFVFRNRRGDRIKLLFWDDDGYAILYKRLQSGVFWYRRWIRPYFHRFLRPCYFPSGILRHLLLERDARLLPSKRDISLVFFFVYFSLHSDSGGE